jgi:hypothetical protein
MRQQSLYRQGKQSEERIKALSEVKDWTWDQKFAIFTENANAVLRYIETTGDQFPVQSVIFEGRPIGKLASYWKRSFRLNNLREEYVQLLEDSPLWTWTVRKPVAPIAKRKPTSNRKTWEQSFQILLNYQKEFGTPNVPQSSVFEGFRLGAWVNSMRTKHRNGELEEEKVLLLARLVGWKWDPLKSSKDELIQIIQNYQKMHGHCLPINTEVFEDCPIGVRVSTLRQSHRRGSLDPRTVETLETIPGWSWSALDASWQNGYKILTRFVVQTGQATPSATLVYEGFNLGQWARVQRIRLTKKQIDPEQYKLLDSLPGWLWSPRDDVWNSKYERLKKVALETGNCKIVNSKANPNYDLLSWIQFQQRSFLSGKLDTERAVLLQQLPGWKWKDQK